MENNQSQLFKLKDGDPGHELILLTEIGIIGLDYVKNIQMGVSFIL